MREAIGSSFLINIILIFIAVISALLIGSISYSKAYKVKDRLIYVIEKYDGYNDEAKEELDKSLKNIGYSITSGSNSDCETIYKKKLSSNYDKDRLLHGINNGVADYDYCVYKYTSGIGEYYGVTAFMHFDIPLIGGFLEFKINGETSLVYDIIDN